MSEFLLLAEAVSSIATEFAGSAGEGLTQISHSGMPDTYEIQVPDRNNPGGFVTVEADCNAVQSAQAASDAGNGHAAAGHTTEFLKSMDPYGHMDHWQGIDGPAFHQAMIAHLGVDGVNGDHLQEAWQGCLTPEPR